MPNVQRVIIGIQTRSLVEGIDFEKHLCVLSNYVESQTNIFSVTVYQLPGRTKLDQVLGIVNVLLIAR